jgi:hypothetical protein
MTDKDPIEALREVAESLLLTQQAMSEDVADMAAAITENTKATEQLGNLLVEGIGRLGAMMDEHKLLQERIGAYVQDAAKQQSGIRDVDRRLRVLEGGNG